MCMLCVRTAKNMPEDASYPQKKKGKTVMGLSIGADQS
jgi:hypothetical protein